MISLFDRRRRARTWALCVAVVLGLPAVALAQEEKAATPSEFSTTWFGTRLGFWFQPELDLKMKIGGVPSFQVVQQFFPNTRIDVREDLSVNTHQAAPVDYLENFTYGIPEATVFFDTEWLSVDFWGVSPFRYKGEKVITRSITFANTTFSISRNIETTLDQFITGVDIKVNILNNRFVRLSPIVAARAFGFAWTLKSQQDGFKATTEDINSPLEVGRWQILPYPEIGAEVRVGYRSVVDVDAKLTGMHIFYQSYEGTTILGEAGVTVYPLGFIEIENVGVRVGARYFHIDVRSKNKDVNDDSDMNLTIFGGNLSLIVRF